MSKAATRAASCDWPGSTLSTLRYASRARSISPFSSNAIPSTKCVSAPALRSPPARSARSGAGFALTESSCRTFCFVWCERGVFAGGFVVGSGNAIRTPTKISAKIIPQHTETPHFVRFLISEILTFGTPVRKPGFANATAGKPVSDLWWRHCRRLVWRFGGPPLGGFRGEPHKLETPNVTPCNANASYADAPSCVFGACAWQFLISVFSLKSPFRFSDSELAIQPSNPQHCNSVSFV